MAKCIYERIVNEIQAKQWRMYVMPNKIKFDPKLHSDLTKRQLKKLGIRRPQKKEKKLSRVKTRMLRR